MAGENETAIAAQLVFGGASSVGPGDDLLSERTRWVVAQAHRSLDLPETTSLGGKVKLVGFQASDVGHITALGPRQFVSRIDLGRTVQQAIELRGCVAGNLIVNPTRDWVINSSPSPFSRCRGEEHAWVGSLAGSAEQLVVDPDSFQNSP